MARKEKTGLDFYSIDTDLFYNRKIKRLLKSFGGNGFLIYSFILTEIYRDKGCFIEWDENTAFDVSDTINVKETLVNEVVSYCCFLGLFNKELKDDENVLTTKNIQEFWKKVSKSANRKNYSIPEEINLLKLKSTPKGEESTPKRQSITLKGEESTQRKVKESKGKESKGNNMPSFLEFKNFALEKSSRLKIEIDEIKLNLKYESWIENDWKTGGDNGHPIKNWKSTLLNTLPYLKKEKSSDKKETFSEKVMGKEKHDLIMQQIKQNDINNEVKRLK